MNVHLVKSFVINFDSVDDCATYLENQLNWKFTKYESSYTGNYCLYKIENIGSMSLNYNYNEIEDIWYNIEFKNFNIVLGINIHQGKKRERITLMKYYTDILIGLGFIEVNYSEFSTSK